METENGFRKLKSFEMSNSSHIVKLLSRHHFFLNHYVYISIYIVVIVVAFVILNYRKCPIKHPGAI